ncbi:unnamed protein product, partial [Rotaria sp. Silwood2]
IMMQLTEPVILHLPRLKYLQVEGKCELFHLLNAASSLHELSVDFDSFSRIMDNEAVHQLLQQRIVCLEIFRLRDIHKLRLDTIFKLFPLIRNLVLSVKDSSVFIDSLVWQTLNIWKEQQQHAYLCIKGPLSDEGNQTLRKWLMEHIYTPITDSFAFDYQNKWIHFWF